jgi:hypothetical protein
MNDNNSTYPSQVPAFSGQGDYAFVSDASTSITVIFAHTEIQSLELWTSIGDLDDSGIANVGDIA